MANIVILLTSVKTINLLRQTSIPYLNDKYKLSYSNLAICLSLINEGK